MVASQQIPNYRWYNRHIIYVDDSSASSYCRETYDLRKSHDSNFGRILGKLIPNSRSYTAITACRASKL